MSSVPVNKKITNLSPLGRVCAPVALPAGRQGSRKIFWIASAALAMTSLLSAIPVVHASLTVGNSPTMSLQNGLVGYWTFDGQDTNWANGKTYDRSGKGNTGTMTN